MNTLHETLSTQIEDAGDLLVVGAGSTGICAALAAARNGLKVTLIDPASHVGGTLVSGIPILGYHDGKRQVVAGIADEIVRELHAQGGTADYPIQHTSVNVDPERLKFVLLDLMEKAGVTLRLHTLVTGVRAEAGRVTHVIVEGKGGRRALTARWFIDATGDADIAGAAGVPTEQGCTSDGKTQPMTLMFGIGGIDKAAFKAWGEDGTVWGSNKKMTALWATMSHKFRNPRKKDFSHFWGPDSRTGEWAFNATRVLDVDGTDSLSLTRAEAEGRRQVFELVDSFLRPHVPGFEHAFVAWTAPKIGVRETRRIHGLYTLTRDDVYHFAEFPDTICHGSYPIDIHSPTGGSTEFLWDHFRQGKLWSIPYRCLVPVGVDNLLVGGRCLSATHEALSAVRVMANTIATGEAAGTAIALADKVGVKPADVDVEQLRNQLRKQGAWLPERGE